MSTIGGGGAGKVGSCHGHHSSAASDCMASSRCSTSLITFVERDVHLPGLGEQGVDPLGENLHPLAAGQRRALVGDVRAGRAALLDDAGRLQLAIGAGDRVRIDEQLLGQHANRRQFLAGREPARGDQVLHLVDDLQVDRHAVGGGDVDLHGKSRLFACTNSLIQFWDE